MSEHNDDDTAAEDPRLGRVARAFESFVASAPSATDRPATFARRAPEPIEPPVALRAAISRLRIRLQPS